MESKVGKLCITQGFTLGVKGLSVPQPAAMLTRQKAWGKREQPTLTIIGQNVITDLLCGKRVHGNGFICLVVASFSFVFPSLVKKESSDCKHDQNDQRNHNAKHQSRRTLLCKNDGKNL